MKRVPNRIEILEINRMILFLLWFFDSNAVWLCLFNWIEFYNSLCLHRTHQCILSILFICVKLRKKPQMVVKEIIILIIHCHCSFESFPGWRFICTNFHHFNFLFSFLSFFFLCNLMLKNGDTIYNFSH